MTVGSTLLFVYASTTSGHLCIRQIVSPPSDEGLGTSELHRRGCGETFWEIPQDK